MKQFRLGYDFLFLPKSSFSYKGDFIGAMTVNVLFKVFNTDGQEILFESDELKEQKLYFDDGSCYLADLIICSFDRENILNFEPNISLLQKLKSELQLQWEIDSYTKDIDEGILEPELITEAEFMDIMKSNIDTFDNIDNRSAQTTSYFTQEIKTTSSKRL
ncbi:hypothetical protein [Bacillus pseudomycoides]|uniref:hypothetical protein n=1 Tax=Bacillus pseudomycoides TaxID=64104 RepID=UPI000BF06FDB|nr:hypothetical protein [Bacillus pseudomycoides]PEM69336.1 hypothetical protein CN619_21620 [Bacillus pseudomycoides]